MNGGRWSTSRPAADRVRRQPRQARLVEAVDPVAADILEFLAPRRRPDAP